MGLMVALALCGLARPAETARIEVPMPPRLTPRVLSRLRRMRSSTGSTPLVTALICVLFFAVSPGDIGAQQPTAVAPHQRVRILVVEQVGYEGTFLRMQGDTAVVALVGNSGEVGIPLSAIQRLEVWERASVGGGAALGFLIGAVVGGGGMFIACSGTSDCPVAALTAGVAVLAGALGAAIGAVIRSESGAWRDRTAEATEMAKLPTQQHRSMVERSSAPTGAIPDPRPGR
jgi:hypothetical protein